MKHIAIVSPHFVPSNLTSVHRARLLSRHLSEFGWRPTIITVHEKYYEEKYDQELCHLLTRDLVIRKAWAFSTKPFRLVGDIGIRSFWGMYQEIKKLHIEDPINFLYITIPSNYAALLGPLAKRCLGIPYGIDYIDPWVPESPTSEPFLSKAWVSTWLAKILEPLAVRYASLISGVAASYYQSVFQRNPDLEKRVIAVAMPYGNEQFDYQYVRDHPQPPFLFSTEDKKFHLVYAGAMLPKAYTVLESLFEAIAQLTFEQTSLMARFQLHFIGTGNAPNDPKRYNILSYIKKYHLEKWVEEHPQRFNYLDVLRHLQVASGILILGSVEKHYTPSKIFQAVMSQRPIFALLHEESSAVGIIRKSNAGLVLTLTSSSLPEISEVKSALAEFIQNNNYSAARVKWENFNELSARRSAQILAEALHAFSDQDCLRNPTS